MPRFRVLYTDYPWADAEIERTALAEVDCELVVSPDNREETLAALAPGCDAIITCWAPVTARVIDAADRCRHIARTGIGLDNIDVGRATQRGIVVTNVPDYCVTEVAEHTIALVYALARKVGYYHHAAKQRIYDAVAGLPVLRVSGKTLGIVGVGQIGRVAARLGAAAGMRVVGHNRSRQMPDAIPWLPLEQLLAESDFVAVLAPLTEQTRHMFSDEEFRLMKPTAFFINTARGGLVDHAALARALAAGEIAGAGLDVQTPEPPDLSQAPYDDPRVIVTPHVAFQSPEATHELRTRVSGQVVAMLRGDEPENVVNRPGG
ncbi:MAG: C-terminal binding protein [Pirellulales bacterium]|nr:C-terminal binding protein [Pirellulales bacterium]